MPLAVWARSSSARSTRSMVAAGTIVVVVVVPGVVELVGTLEAVATASDQRGLRVDEFLLCIGECGLGFADAFGRRRHRLARLDEVGAGGGYIADRGRFFGEQHAVAIERFDVAGCFAAELLACRGQGVLRFGDARLRRLDLRLGRRYRIPPLGRRRCFGVGGFARVDASDLVARRNHQGDSRYHCQGSAMWPPPHVGRSFDRSRDQGRCSQPSGPNALTLRPALMP